MSVQSRGSLCRGCGRTEQQCAYNYGRCCPDSCTHWTRFTADGEYVGYTTDVDEVTARRRAKDRERDKQRRAAS